MLWSFLLTAALPLGAASYPGTLVVPAIRAGPQELSPSILSKVTELTGQSLRRAGAAPPAAAADSAAPLVDEARGRYIRLDFAGAVQSAEAAIERYRAEPALVRDARRLLDAHVYAALANLELGKAQKTQEHLTAALVLKPDLQLSEADFSPTAILAVEKARAALNNSGAKGTLSVTTSPAFGKVKVDGKELGEAPLTSPEIFAGWHYVDASLDGFLPQSAWVEVKKDGAASLELTLAPNVADELKQKLAEAILVGEGNKVEDLARQLCTVSGASSVVLLAVAAAGDRYAVSAARVSLKGSSVRALTSLSKDLVDAPRGLEQLARSILETRSSSARVVGVAPSMTEIDFGLHFMGHKPPPGTTTVTSPYVDLNPPPPPPVEKPSASWKPWAVIGGGVGLALIGGGVYLLTRTDPKQPGVVVTVVLPTQP